MTCKPVKYGNIEINLPDETFGCFWVFEDLADFFNAEYQSQAVSILKRELKNSTDIKPRPGIDYEADNTSIQSRSADTIFKVAEIINNLATDELKTSISDKEKDNILAQLKAWKRPKAKKWVVGDVFSMKLKDGTFMFGQVVDTHLTAKSPSCAVFELCKKTEEINEQVLNQSKVISIQHNTAEYLSNGTYCILFNARPFIDTHGTNKNISRSDSALVGLCNAYCGLAPWNVYYDGYFDKMLREGVSRPESALVLNEKDRNKYRLEYFGINENNEYANKK